MEKIINRPITYNDGIYYMFDTFRTKEDKKYKKMVDALKKAIDLYN